MLFAVAVVACSRNPAPGSSLTGAETARDATTQFLNAVKAQDLQAMATVWGNENGPARDGLDRTDLDKRLIIMVSCYNHDRFQIIDEQQSTGGASMVRVSLTRGPRTKTANFTAVRGPSRRFYVYVNDPDFIAMRDFCA